MARYLEEKKIVHTPPRYVSTAAFFAAAGLEKMPASDNSLGKILRPRI